MSKYLARPDDNMVFVQIECGLYQTKNGATDQEGNRQRPYSHFTYDNLVGNFGFIPISESEVPIYEERCDKYFRKLTEETRKLQRCGE